MVVMSDGYAFMHIAAYCVLHMHMSTRAFAFVMLAF